MMMTSSSFVENIELRKPVQKVKPSAPGEEKGMTGLVNPEDKPTPD